MDDHGASFCNRDDYDGNGNGYGRDYSCSWGSEDDKRSASP